MTETKSPLDQAVEFLVYAPVGLAATARDLVPTLVTRGRQELDPQVGLARMVGEIAVAQGRNQVEKIFDRTRAQAEATLRHLGLLGDEAPHRPHAPAPAPPDSPASGPVRRRPATDQAGPSPSTSSDSSPAAVTLAIPDYESLSASQVVPRLSSLSPEELEAVRAYEDAHRGRKTILNKIAKLSGY
ncbi:MAG TPA: hypothetical protein VGV93_13270 [Acidimicrobiales bacterium]|nr:hypothetical protein [Acidimicrobiales bacterium]